MSAIELREISKTFDKVLALSRVDLQVASGSRLVLLGKSGAGKTTLLRIICGFEQPDTGEVWMNGCNVTRSAPATRNTSLVTQEYALYPHLTVRQNLSTALAACKLSADDREQRIAEVLGWFEIEQLVERRPSQLSGGQSQRVALAKAVVRRPRLLILDEPLSQIDPILRHEIRTLILSVVERFATTLIMVTHDPLDAMLIASRIAVVDDGQILQAGTPQELYVRPTNKLVADLMSPFGMNWFPIETLRGCTMVQLLGGIPEGKQSVGFRPEQIQDYSSESSAQADAILFSVDITHLHHIGFAQIATATLAGQSLRIVNGARPLELGMTRLCVPMNQCVWL